MPTGPARRRPAWSAGRRSAACTTPRDAVCSPGRWTSSSMSSRSATGSPRSTRPSPSSCTGSRLPSSDGSGSCPASSGELTLAAAVARLADWLAGRLAAVPLPVPPVARRPVYSTWYTFTQDLDQDRVAAETALAVQLGCGSVFVDDGWQRLAVGRGYAGCGDWVPDTAKFGDLVAFSADVHDQGAGVVLWIAPLLLGRDADVFATLGRFAPHAAERLRLPHPRPPTPRGPRAPGGHVHPAGRRLRPGRSQDRLPGYGHGLSGDAVQRRHRRRR